MGDLSEKGPGRRISESWIALLGVTAIALYLCWLMVQPFVGVILWASVLAIISYPYYLKWRQRGWSESNSAMLATVFVILLVIVPLGLVVVALVRQAVPAAESVQDAIEKFLRSDSAILKRVERAVDLGQWRDPAYVGAQLKSVAAFVGSHTLGILGGALGAVVQILLVMFALYYMLRDASRIVPAVRAMLPLEDDQAQAVFKRSHEVISASVHGVLGGLQVFGILGLIVGPVVVAVTMSLIDVMRRARSSPRTSA